MSVYTKLAQIQSAVRGLTKNQQGYNYTYVDGNKVFEAIRPLMCDANILLAPEVVNIKNDPITYQKWDRGAKQLVPVTEVLCTLQIKMNWIDADTGETFSQMWSSTGMNGFDKGFGSALTYGERYYLLKFFHIPTDRDDVDRVASDRDKAIDDAKAEMVTILQSRINDMQNGVPQIELKPWPNQETYMAMVKASAERRLKHNMPIYDYFCIAYRPNEQQKAEFLGAVDYYRVNNNL